MKNRYTHQLRAIERAALAAGIGHKTLARALGVNRVTWWRWRAGEQEPTIALWEKVIHTATELGLYPIQHTDLQPEKGNLG